jgi:hypothetical protein
MHADDFDTATAPFPLGTQTTLTMADVLGPRPDPRASAVVQELMGMVGLTAVKASVTNLIELAARNYDDELVGRPVRDVPLNRLFLGNPGKQLTRPVQESWAVGIARLCITNRRLRTTTTNMTPSS